MHDNQRLSATDSGPICRMCGCEIRKKPRETMREWQRHITCSQACRLDWLSARGRERTAFGTLANRPPGQLPAWVDYGGANEVRTRDFGSVSALPAPSLELRREK